MSASVGTGQTGAGVRDSVWRAVLIGLLPLILLVGISGVTYIVVVLVRHLLDVNNFALQQEVAIILWATGLVLALVAYGIGVGRVLGQLTRWSQDGLVRRVVIVRWMLWVTVIVIVLPLILALVIPQHPAVIQGG